MLSHFQLDNSCPCLCDSFSMQITGCECLRTLLNWVMARTNSAHIKFIESCVRDYVLWIRSIWRKKWLIRIWTEMRECVQHVMPLYLSSPLFKAFCKSKRKRGAAETSDLIFSFRLRWSCWVLNADLVKLHSESIISKSPNPWGCRFEITIYCTLQFTAS